MIIADIRYTRKINSLILVENTIVVVRCIPAHRNTDKYEIHRALMRAKCKVCSAASIKRNFVTTCSDILICGSGRKRPDKLQVIIFKIRKY